MAKKKIMVTLCYTVGYTTTVEAEDEKERKKSDRAANGHLRDLPHPEKPGKSSSSRYTRAIGRPMTLK